MAHLSVTERPLCRRPEEGACVSQRRGHFSVAEHHSGCLLPKRRRLLSQRGEKASLLLQLLRDSVSHRAEGLSLSHRRGGGRSASKRSDRSASQAGQENPRKSALRALRALWVGKFVLSYGSLRAMRGVRGVPLYPVCILYSTEESASPCHPPPRGGLPTDRKIYSFSVGERE